MDGCAVFCSTLRMRRKDACFNPVNVEVALPRRQKIQLHVEFQIFHSPCCCQAILFLLKSLQRQKAAVNQRVFHAAVTGTNAHIQVCSAVDPTNTQTRNSTGDQQLTFERLIKMCMKMNLSPVSVAIQSFPFEGHPNQPEHLFPIFVKRLGVRQDTGTAETQFTKSGICFTFCKTQQVRQQQTDAVVRGSCSTLTHWHCVQKCVD